MAEQRYQREIDELLRRMERDSASPLPFRRRRTPWARARRALRVSLPTQSTIARFMRYSVSLLLAAFGLGLVAPLLAPPLAGLALASFVLALALSVWRGAAGKGDYTSGLARHSAPPTTADWDRLVWRFRGWLRHFRR